MLGPWQALLLGPIYLDFGAEQNVKCSARVHNGSPSAIECDSWVYSFIAVQIGGLNLKMLVASEFEAQGVFAKHTCHGVLVLSFLPCCSRLSHNDWHQSMHSHAWCLHILPDFLLLTTTVGHFRIDYSHH